MKTLNHDIDTRTAPGSHLVRETAAPMSPRSAHRGPRTAMCTHAGVPTITRTWCQGDLHAVNQYAMHAFAKKHHSQRAKST